MAAHAPGKNRLYITVIEARDLPPADANGKADPYVRILDVRGLTIKGKDYVRTKHISKTLEPKWNESFEFDFDYKLAKLKIQVWDHDSFTADDIMGKTKVPIDLLFNGQEFDFWFPLHKGTVVKGELHLKLRAELKLPIAWPGSALLITGPPQLVLGLGWDFSKKITVDLDASIIALDKNKQQVDFAAFNHRTAFNGAISHAGDNRTGEGKGDDEEISIDLSKLPPECHTLVFMVNSFSRIPFTKIKTAYIRLREKARPDATLAFYRLSKMTDKIGLFFGSLTRYGPHWHFQTYVTPVDGHFAGASLPDVVNILPNFA